MIGRPTSGSLASSFAAVVSALAALSCCLPLGPFLLAAGLPARRGGLPIAATLPDRLLSLDAGSSDSCRRSGRASADRRRRALNVTVLLCSTGLVAAMLFGYVPASAPAGQPAVADLQLDTFRQAFNAAADRTRVVVLLSPT
jgi:hypothetical protein